jgi:hypothetical protein
MRTTVTLDPDVERLIRNAMREGGVSFKQALNDAARRSLSGKGGARVPRFVQKSYRLGAARLFRWDKALAAADALEDEELSRKIALRK